VRKKSVPLTEIELQPSNPQPDNLLRFPGSSKAEKRNVFLTGQIYGSLSH